MLSKQVQIKKSEKPEEWSDGGINFINKMIQRKQENSILQDLMSQHFKLLI